jgi:molybdopterin/thiamine biosynthesis adenylyltransferase
MTADRFDRQVRFFGRAGQEKLAACDVAVVGIGGLGTQVVQQLAHLGVRRFAVIDNEELDETNLNRYVGSRHDDPIPGTRKVDIAERIVHSINPEAAVEKVFHRLTSRDAFAVLRRAGVAFGCLDSDGARLVLNEFCAAHERRYFDLATDVIPGTPVTYGGRVCAVWDRPGCVVCYGLLDLKEAAEDLAGPEASRDREALYGVLSTDLDRSGPSVVSINGVVASLAVTEFLLAITGIRPPKPILTYRGHLGGVSVAADAPVPDCYYCGALRGRGDAAGLERYL